MIKIGDSVRVQDPEAPGYGRVFEIERITLPHPRYRIDCSFVDDEKCWIWLHGLLSVFNTNQVVSV